MLTLPLILYVLRLVASFRWYVGGHYSFQPLESFVKKNMLFMLMAPNSFLSDPVRTILMCLLTHFYILALFSLVCSSVLLPNILCTVPFTYLRYYGFVLFVIPKPSFFFQLLVCISLTDAHG